MALLQVVMGSKSDLSAVRESKMLDILDDVLGSDMYEVHVCSAHRNAAELQIFVDEVCEGDTRVFIGIAGMAAALPGALAGASNMTRLVIGVPLDVHGIDSCLYMPPGVPVATAGVGKTGLKQAALLACQALAIANPAVIRSLRHHLETNAKAPQFSIDPHES